MLTTEYLKTILDYDGGTGVFRWKFRPERDSKWNGKWAGEIAGSPNSDGYILIKVLGKKEKAHRLAWLYTFGEPPKNQIDHINRVRYDNRISNLRLANNSENAKNRTVQSNNKSGIVGVSWKAGRTKKWVATCKVGDKQKHLGYFDRIEDAAAARDKAAKEEYGEFYRA